ncbi:MAG: hypothetical protein RLN88_04060 [Ekhidna sp.]|uniref:hypothetical protein n=1 Tax=Ekhidna sp. TaxID=2608089 RepID=UPI0032F0302B
MIFDTSYSDKEITRQIDKMVGKSFSWKQRWKMGGIGSRRMTIHGISDEYKKYMNADHYVSTANIELRPKGIILHFRHKLQAYSWIMPYTSLSIQYKGSLRLESAGKFIQFDEPRNQKFIRQMLELARSGQTTLPS